MQLLRAFARLQHHLLVISQEANERKAILQFQQPFENHPGIGSAIDEVSQHDNSIVSPWANFGEQRVKRMNAAVDVTDGKAAHWKEG